MANRDGMDPGCLHCLLCSTIEDFLESNELDDVLVAYTAIADTLGDLLANDKHVFEYREKVMSCIKDRALERAQQCVSEDQKSSMN